MDATNDFNLEDGFRYIYETYCLALCELTLGELMLQDYNDSVHEKTLRVIIIDSLFSSAAINTYKLLDTSKGTFNIRRLVNKCNSEIKEINGAKLLPLKVKCDEQRFQRLESRRNKSLAHPDFIKMYSVKGGSKISPNTT